MAGFFFLVLLLQNVGNFDISHTGVWISALKSGVSDVRNGVSKFRNAASALPYLTPADNQWVTKCFNCG
jgi:hypothetical protein